MDGYTCRMFCLATELFASKVSLPATLSHEQTSPLFDSIKFDEFNVCLPTKPPMWSFHRVSERGLGISCHEVAAAVPSLSLSSFQPLQSFLGLLFQSMNFARVLSCLLDLLLISPVYCLNCYFFFFFLEGEDSKLWRWDFGKFLKGKAEVKKYSIRYLMC